MCGCLCLCACSCTRVFVYARVCVCARSCVYARARAYMKKTKLSQRQSTESLRNTVTREDMSECPHVVKDDLCELHESVLFCVIGGFLNHRSGDLQSAFGYNYQSASDTFLR